MKFINKAKRFLLKVNFVDTTLVIFLLLLTLLLYNKIFPFKSFKKLHNIPSEKRMFIDIIIPEDIEWIHQYIHKGDKQKGLQDKIFAEVIDSYYSKDSNGKERSTVKLEVLVFVEPGQCPLLFGRYPLRVGQMILFQPEEYVISAYIAKIEESSDADK